jgi:zinc protease
MMALAGRNQSNAREMAELQFSKILFGEGHPYARSVSGSVESIEKITLQDLQAIHGEYFTGGNTILAIVSSLDSATVFGLVSQYFGKMPPTTHEISVPAIPLTLSEAGQTTSDSMQIGSQQSYVYLGYTFQADSRYEMPLEIMTSMLSGKLAFSLREQKGWAYRLGSRISNWKDRYVFVNYIGTGRETTQPAIQGILQEIEQFRQWDFQEKDLQREKNSITAALVRRRASRESQAYTLALNEFRGYPTSYYFRIYDEIKGIEIDTIKKLRQEYLQTEKYHLFYTIPTAEEQKEKKMGMPQMKMPH